MTPTARPQSPVETKIATAPEPDQIASLAYSLWQERGSPEGSPEADWLRAEEELTTSH